MELLELKNVIPQTFKNSVDGVNSIVEMTEERINKLEEYEENSPNLSSREKTGQKKKKKKEKKKMNRTLVICRKIKKKKFFFQIIRIPNGGEKEERVSKYS